MNFSTDALIMGNSVERKVRKRLKITEIKRTNEPIVLIIILLLSKMYSEAT